MGDFITGIMFLLLACTVVCAIHHCGYEAGDSHGKCVMKCAAKQAVVERSWLNCVCKVEMKP